jgi:hypothetical protein
MGGKTRGTVENNTPEFCQGTVLKTEVFALRAAKTMFTGGLFVLEYKGNIHRHHIGILIYRHVV